MDYRVFSALSGEEESSTEAHVFARAYRAAWRSAYACEPVGRHRVDGLELIIDFGGDPVAPHETAQAHAGNRSSHTPDPAPTNVPKGDHHDQ